VTYNLQLFFAVLLLASLGGEFLVFLLKKLLVDQRTSFTFDLSGIVERMALVTAIAAGGLFLIFIPVIILARAFFILEQKELIKYSGILNIKEPAIEFQKIKLKSDLVITLLSSPLIGAAFGVLARIL
jgi:hypothetical protein